MRWPLHLIRGVLGVGMMAMFVFAVSHLPLTTAYTLFFVAPLLITALSALLLGERVGAQRWTAIVLGFTGVLVAMRPTGEGVLTWAGLAILGAATGYSLSAITVRVLGRTDSNQSMVFWLLTFMALGCGALAAPGWVEIQARHWPVIGAIGVVGILGQYAITEAFARGEASIVAPLEYTALVWSVGFDRFVWNVMPDGATWIGAAIIVASGAYLLRQKPPVRPEAQVQP